MIKLIDILKEIGDATNPVPYHKASDEDTGYEKRLGYEFSIGDDVYVVHLYITEVDPSWPKYDGLKKGSKYVVIWFGLKTDKYKDGDTSRTNKFQQYSIMATVTKILKDYIEEHPEVAEISYEPVQSNNTDFAREKLYSAYFKKNLPGWKYHSEAGFVYLTNPEQTQEPSKIKRFLKNK